MKQVATFQDLQNETCEIDASLDGFYIGRRSTKMMNINIEQLEKILATCKAHVEENKGKQDEQIRTKPSSTKNTQ